MEEEDKEAGSADLLGLFYLILSSKQLPYGGGVVALRVVGGDEKGSLESETVKYGR
jgi:hypothetical protein